MQIVVILCSFFAGMVYGLMLKPRPSPSARCSQGYDYERSNDAWIDELESLLSDRSSDA